MKTLTRIAAFTSLLAALPSKAQDTGFGLGIVLGDPTGISWKGWIADTRALDGALAWNLNGQGAFHTHIDYLFHNFDLINVNRGRMALYYGPGARLRVWDGNEHWYHGEWHEHDSRADLAFRIPVGLNYQSAGAPIDVFLEVAPAVGIVPATYFDFDAGLGARFWF